MSPPNMSPRSVQTQKELIHGVCICIMNSLAY